MPKGPNPYNAVETAYQHLGDLETVLQVFEDTGKAIEYSFERLNAKDKDTLKHLGLNPNALRGNLVLLTHIVHGIEVMHRGSVALTADECNALAKAPLVFKRCVGTLATLSKAKKPHLLEFLLNRHILDQSSSALSTLTQLSDLFSRPFCEALQHFDDDFALRKVKPNSASTQLIVELIQKTDSLQ